MKCPKCQFDNPDGANYCLNCGSRMDGNIFCPKCGNIISPDADVCPRCGMKIPHKEEVAEDAVAIEKKKHALGIFNKVFLILSIIILGSSLLSVFGQYIVSSAVAKSELYGYAHYYLVAIWGNLRNALEGVTSIYRQIAIYTQFISQFLIVALNIITTYVFGIIGIVKASKSLCAPGEKECNTYRYLALVYVSNVLASSLLLATNYDVSNGAIYSISSSMTSYCATFGALFAFMIIVRIIFSFDRKNISLFFEKITFSLVFFISIYMISNLGGRLAYSGSDNLIYYHVYTMVGSLLHDLADNISSNAYITSLIFGCSSAIFVSMEYLVLAVIAVFFAIGFFSERERNMRFKIPCYAMGFSVALLATIELVVSFTLILLMNHVSSTYALSTMPWTNFVFSVLLFGASIASLSISRSYRHYEKLMAQTTVK